MRTPACGLLMMLVVARQRISDGGNALPVDSDAFLQTFQQAGCSRSIVPNQATRPACGCAPCPPWRPASHAARGTLLTGSRYSPGQMVEHIAQFVCAASLHRLLGAENCVDRGSERLRSAAANSRSAQAYASFPSPCSAPSCSSLSVSLVRTGT